MLKNKFESLINFLLGIICHIQDEVLYNERILKDTAISLFLALIWKFLTKYGNINSIFHSDKISADSKCLKRFASEMILSFSMKI